MMLISKITLGTAQLGFNYGIANVNNKPEFKKSLEILKFCWENGINTFDTAPSYGNSEEIIGSFISSELKDKAKELVIITKLPAIKLKDMPNFDNIYSYIKEQILKSIIKLKIKRIPIYLLHHAPDIFLKDGLVIKCLNQIKNEKLIDRFGISIYTPAEVKASLNFKEIDVIQVPINIFDHRLIETGLLNKLYKKKCVIFARSIYLQGLFFMTPEKLPQYLKIAKEPLKKLHNFLRENNIDMARLALLFVRDLPEITSLVIGVENLEQVKKNIELVNEKSFQSEIQQRIFEEFSNLSERIINPSLWNK